MTATIESSVKYDFDLTSKDSGVLMSKTLNMFNLILMLIEASKNESELKQSMRVMKDNLDPYFKFGFGSNHMWVHQKMNEKTSKTRLLIVRFD